MSQNSENSSSLSGSSLPGDGRATSDFTFRHLMRSFLRRLRRSRADDGALRDSLDEIIEEREEAEIPLDNTERTLVANILSLRDRSIEDVMVPRADIVAVESKASLDEVIQVMTREGHSRLPVYRDTLDDAIGMVHIRDVLAWREESRTFQLGKILRRVLFVAPSMKVLELLLEMRVKRSHMALVVDEFGGVDGLVTIEDLVEEIVGEIEDEHDRSPEPGIVRRADGSFDADARTPIEVLEEEFGEVLTDEEREEIDTMGGLVFAIAGRVPIRGELITHPSGVEFEVLDADPRRVRRLRVRAPEPVAATAVPQKQKGAVGLR
jgi:CBS domain containing-hemolysin-like protein